MTDSSSKELIRLIEQETKEACLAFLSILTVDKRRDFFKPAIKKHKELEDLCVYTPYEERHKPQPSGNSILDQFENTKVCIFSTATLSELLKLGWHVVPKDGFILDIVQILKPKWINEWASESIEKVPQMYNEVRLLYEAGLCSKPQGEGYILGMITCLSGWPQSSVQGLYDEKMPLVERIRTSADIRDNDLWRLFEVEGSGQLSLASFDKYIGKHKTSSWMNALSELAEDGTLNRERLLDASLSALERDFAQFRAGWFSRFHEYLKPTIEERIRLQKKYLNLLSSSIPPTVSFTLKALVLLDKANVLEPKTLLEHLQPVLQARAKNTVSTALRLLINTTKDSQELSETSARLACEALIHETTDIQKKALDIIETLKGHKISSVVAEMQQYKDGIAPSLQDRFAQMTGSSFIPEISEEEQISENAKNSAKIIPIDSFDELNRAFLYILETPDNPLEVERTLDGLARKGAAKPKNFEKIIGPLKKRAHDIIKRHTYDELQYQIAKLAFAYATDTELTPYGDYKSNIELTKDPTKKHKINSFEDIFSLRSAELLNQIKLGYTLPLLCAPSDSMGFVSVQDLLSRYSEYKACGISAGKVDMALALMRLSLDNRESSLSSLTEDTEFEQALSYALGKDVSIGKTSWLWVAAAAAKSPYIDQPNIANQHGEGNPDAGKKVHYKIHFSKKSYSGVAASIEPQIKKSPPNLFLPSLFHLTTAPLPNNICPLGYNINMIRWCSTVWPLNQEPFLSNAIPYVNNFEIRTNPPDVAFLELIIKPYVRLGKMGSWALALSLANIDPSIRSLALDAMITTIEEKRLDFELMRQAMAELIPSGILPVKRWTTSFTMLGSVSKAHMTFTQKLIQGSLRHNPSEAPRDTGGLVELLYEFSIATEEQIKDPNAIEYLQKATAGRSNKLKRFAEKLLELG